MMKKLLTALLLLLIAILSLELHWRKEYALIRIELDMIHPILEYSFPFLMVFYILFIYPFVLRPRIPIKSATEVIIYFLATILTFTPAMLLHTLPFDKSQFRSYTITVYDINQSRSGGSAPKHYLKSSSWRQKKQEYLISDFNIFSHFKKGDKAKINIGRDLLGHQRIVSIQKIPEL